MGKRESLENCKQVVLEMAEHNKYSHREGTTGLLDYHKAYARLVEAVKEEKR